jgi:hypothetical protein
MSINQYYAEYNYGTACPSPEKVPPFIQGRDLQSGAPEFSAKFPLECISLKYRCNQADKAKTLSYI